ncbi:hypothetical protein DS745_09205 [Anaerobacillus alkaliphilus]|uniref:SbsA Ig-like domain-containing protein n=1 Tax=Anaerobacillus alkaliphilus TaxID=1548597 RepID=A0A4Q0VTN2_9BACI|nr:Ig-like domain-containing protein [Anaerobacillus alkaliphilus]RXJ01648.1 hypothetical protein DS745_09205 [Anaerobacillus alkaliphilus]
MKNSLKALILLIFVFSTMPASLAENNHEVLVQRVANDIYKVWTITFNEALDPSTVNETTVLVKNSFNRNLDVTVSLSADGKSISVNPSQMYVPGLEYELFIENVASITNEVLSPGVRMPFVIEEVKEEKVRNSTSPKSQGTTSQQSNQTTNNNQANNSPFTNNNSSSSKPTTSQPSTKPATNQQTNTTQQQAEKKPVHLTNVKVDVNSMVSNVTVKTSNFVAVVRVDGKKMHYQGNNVHELAVPGLKRGNTIKIDAFSSYERGSLIETINHNVK